MKINLEELKILERNEQVEIFGLPKKTKTVFFAKLSENKASKYNFTLFLVPGNETIESNFSNIVIIHSELEQENIKIFTVKFGAKMKKGIRWCIHGEIQNGTINGKSKQKESIAFVFRDNKYYCGEKKFNKTFINEL